MSVANGYADEATVAPKSPVETFAGDLGSAELSTRRDAAYGLAKLGPEAFGALDALVKGLSDRDEQVWMQSAMAIARIGSDAEKAIEALADNLGDRDQQKRYRAAWVLSRIGPSSIPSLQETLKSESADRRAAALDAMGWMSDNASDLVPTLVLALEDDVESVRRQAATSLSRLGTPATEALGQAAMFVVLPSSRFHLATSFVTDLSRSSSPRSPISKPPSAVLVFWLYASSAKIPIKRSPRSRNCWTVTMRMLASPLRLRWRVWDQRQQRQPMTCSVLSRIIQAKAKKSHMH